MVRKTISFVPCLTRTGSRMNDSILTVQRSTWSWQINLISLSRALNLLEPGFYHWNYIANICNTKTLLQSNRSRRSCLHNQYRKLSNVTASPVSVRQFLELDNTKEQNPAKGKDRKYINLFILKKGPVIKSNLQNRTRFMRSMTKRRFWLIVNHFTNSFNTIIKDHL